MNVFLGVTGASGAPYAARLLQALSASGARVGLCISDAGVQVCAAELYGDIGLSRDDVTARLVDGLEGVEVVGLRDYTTPYASGSARVDGYVVCPCSMSTAASIASDVVVTPLGLPVVPEEYMSESRSSPATSWRGSSVDCSASQPS